MMNKIPCASQNTEAKTLPADVCIFDCFGCFHLLLSTQLIVSLTPELNGWFMFLCKNFLLCWNRCKQHSKSLMRCCFWSTVTKRDTHFEHSFFIDKCSWKMKNTLPSVIFNSFAISHNFNLRLAKMSLWIFWCFLGQLLNLGDLSVEHYLCL